MDYVFGAIGVILVIGLFLFLFGRLTPDHAPANLSGYYGKTKIFGIIIVIAIVAVIVALLV